MTKQNEARPEDAVPSTAWLEEDVSDDDLRAEIRKLRRELNWKIVDLIGTILFLICAGWAQFHDSDTKLALLFVIAAKVLFAPSNHRVEVIRSKLADNLTLIVGGNHL